MDEVVALCEGVTDIHIRSIVQQDAHVLDTLSERKCCHSKDAQMRVHQLPIQLPYRNLSFLSMCLDEKNVGNSVFLDLLFILGILPATDEQTGQYLTCSPVN